ncbi:MAG: LacI family DNA-binding transcriptional regulator [Pseudomonadota bacterium]
MDYPSDSPAGIRHIAHQAGVSTATVSRVLNGSARVSEGTRARVMQAISQHNYRPNAAAKALATRRTRTVAAVIPTLEHSIFAMFMNVLEDELAAAGYNLVIATHRFDYQTELKRCSDVLHLGAEAVIVSGAEHNPALLSLMRDARIPCVYTSVHAPDSEVPTYGYDNRALAVRAVQYLADLGHRRIAVIHGPTDVNDRMRLRVAGALDGARANPAIDLMTIEATIGAQGGAEQLAQWAKSDALPDACLCFADVYALGILQEAQRLGIQIPHDMSVMGFENLDWTANSFPRLTCMSLPTVDMGKATAASIVGHLDQNLPLSHQLFEAEIVERASTQRLNAP